MNTWVKVIRVGILFVAFLALSCVELYEPERVFVQPQKCTTCHSYPPDKGAHTKHLEEKQKDCFECHFNSVRVITHTDNTGGNTSYWYEQQHQIVGDDSLPVSDYAYHVNGVIDINFQSRVKDSVNNPSTFDPTVRIWNVQEKSCAYMKHCHKPTNPEHFKKALWKKPSQ